MDRTGWVCLCGCWWAKWMTVTVTQKMPLTIPWRMPVIPLILLAADGYTITLDSQTIKENNNILVAFHGQRWGITRAVLPAAVGWFRSAKKPNGGTDRQDHL